MELYGKCLVVQYINKYIRILNLLLAIKTYFYKMMSINIQKFLNKICSIYRERSKGGQNNKCKIAKAISSPDVKKV